MTRPVAVAGGAGRAPYAEPMHTLLAILHVVGAVFIVGPMAILPQSGLRAIRAREPGAVSTIARSTFIFTLASVVVAVIGFGVVGTTDKQYNLSISTPWVLISLIVWVVAVALSLFAVVPALRSAAEHLQSPDTDHVNSNDYKRIAMTSGVVSLLLLVVVVLMVWKP